MSRAEPLQWTTLALLMRPQGRRGELLAELLTDFPDRFADRPNVFLASPGFTGSEAEARAAVITGHWLPVGRNHGRVVLAFAGIGSISEAATLEGLEVIIPESERVELDDDANYISDLVGCSVFALHAEDLTTGSAPPAAVRIGTVEDVDFPTSADGTRRLEDAAPLLVVRDEGGSEVLIPYVKAFLVVHSVAERRIEMRLPEGLVELNRNPQAVDLAEGRPGNHFVDSSDNSGNDLQ